MIVRETVMIGERACIRTYSDEGKYIQREEIRYESALDLAQLDRIYQETEDLIVHTGEAEEGDYTNALREMGVEV